MLGDAPVELLPTRSVERAEEERAGEFGLRSTLASGHLAELLADIGRDIQIDALEDRHEDIVADDEEDLNPGSWLLLAS